MVLVPYCGTLALVGGLGRYRWSISRPEKWNGVYTPEWRPLTRYVAREKPFAVPDGHTRIGSMNAGAAVISVDGDTWALDGSDKPVGSGTRATPVLAAIRLFTLTYL